MNASIRQRMVDHLRQGPATLAELAAVFDLRTAEARDHLEHVRQSVRRSLRWCEDPPRCRQCDFVFRKRSRVSTPGRCPQCRSSRVEPARFWLEERS